MVNVSTDCGQRGEGGERALHTTRVPFFLPLRLLLPSQPDERSGFRESTVPIFF